MTESIQAAWNSFRAECVPADAPEHQVNFIKATFYAGAHIALKLIEQHTRIENEKEAQRKVNLLFKEVVDAHRELAQLAQEEK